MGTFRQGPAALIQKRWDAADKTERRALRALRNNEVHDEKRSQEENAPRLELRRLGRRQCMKCAQLSGRRSNGRGGRTESLAGVSAVFATLVEKQSDGDVDGGDFVD